MLDFLRRKDKRKPHDAAAAAAAASSALASASATAAAAASRKPAAEKTGILVDRNAAPAAAASSGSRRPNAQARGAAPVAGKHIARSKPEKENASSSHKNDKASADAIAPEGSHRRWGKRGQASAGAGAQQSQYPASSQPQAPQQEKKRKNRRQRPPKHEAAVHTKSVTTDRRRSVKVAVSPVTQPAPKRGSSKTSAQPAANVGPDKHNTRTSAQRPSAGERPGHQRKPSNAGSSSGKVETAQHQQQPTWPHVDLAAVLSQGDIAAADIPVRRIAAAAARDDATRLKMIREGVASSIITLLRHKDATLDMRRLATFAIAELAVLEACEDDLVAADIVVVLIKLINLGSDSDRSTLGSACRALRNLLGGKESTAVQAARYGCVEPLLAIVDGRSGRGEEPEVVVEAAAAISNLSHHGTRFQSYVIKHGGLGALTTLGMKTDNEEAMFHVVNVLAEFAREIRWHKAIVSADGLLSAFRALRLARDLEVVAEASRLVGNVAVTQKARAAVREAGGIVALIDRLNRCKSFKDVVPAFDIVRALANVCLDGRSAAEALSQKDAAAVLLRVYTAQDASEKLIKTAFRALQVLAHGSATRRAKVLYAVGIEVKQAGLAGLPVKRLYDLRQAILEDIETGDRCAAVAMPESLERLSRASVRLINSGVVSHSRQQLPGGTRDPRDRNDAPGLSAYGQNNTSSKIGISQVPLNGSRLNDPHRPTNGRVPLKAENLIRSAHADANKFRSTGRVVSVTRNCKPKAQPTGVKHLAESRAVGDDDEYGGLPRGNEETAASEAELRARLLAREADGNMVQDFFEIGQVLGKGGYGSVFMAKDIRSGDIVAIKRFHNSGALVDKKAIKEQNIWKGLHHPNVVEFKGSFVGDNGTLNLVVEYVDGLSLAEHLSQYSAFPETLVAEIARQVLSGLQYLHLNGVTHRDLKPANILVDSSASVKICDFGVSRSENVQTINPGQQHMVGTPWYIAPEMVEYRPYTTSVDIWSLGCTVLELATGRRPYHELSAMQVLFRMVEDRRPPIPAHLSAEAQDFLKACWIWDPQERPSAADLLRHPFTLKARKFSDSSKQSSGSSSIQENLELGTS